MKNIYTLFIINILSLSCKAQSPILNLSDLGWENLSGAYYKDTNNQLNPFEGTYIYTNGNTSFKIVLQKKTMSFVGNTYYEDILIGEYQYIENGVEKANTLSDLNVNYPDKSHHNITANLIITQGQTGCEDCLPNEKALRGGLLDEPTHNIGQLTIRRITVNSQPAISIYIKWEMRYEGVPQNSRFPGGEYILLKQL